MNESGVRAKVRVELAERGYDILIGEGLLARAGEKIRPLMKAGRDRVFVVADETVARLHLDTLGKGLGAAGIRFDVVQTPPGEGSKSFGGLDHVLSALIEKGAERDDLILAFGGGVVGDLAGLAAGLLKRGARFVQLPTTLLAQVDSSVGGKTGVNHPGGKNLIGAFHQPSAVIADTETLKTLPARELRAGLAEVIKYGLICDEELFTWLEQNIEKLLAHDAAALTYAIHRSCEIKAEIVGRDEREQGDRALLNLGHTFGHALESVTGYTKWLHGEAVGAGLLMAATMSCESGLMPAASVERLRKLLVRTGLPTEARELSPDSVMEHMRIDKKVKSGRIRLVLMRSIGGSFVTADYPDAALRRTLEAHLG
jgi:3-dehydroquinate synthase